MGDEDIKADADTEAAIAKAPARLGRIRILDIRESDTALRGVDRTSEKFIKLFESVKQYGVIETITVRNAVDPVTKAKYYGLVNGLQRFTAAKDAGFDEIDAKIIDATDYEVMLKQIILNAVRVDTTVKEYTEALKRIITMNPSITMKELAEQLNASESFIYDRLSLLKLNNEVAKKVEDGSVNLTSAYTLAKLPPEEQPAFLDRAIELDPREFVPQVTKRVKEINEAKRKGENAAPETFAPTAHVRKLDELKSENAKPTMGKLLVDKAGAADAYEGFALGVQWAMCLDVISQQQQIAKNEARLKEQAEAKVRRAEEKQKKEAEAVVANAMK